MQLSIIRSTVSLDDSQRVSKNELMMNESESEMEIRRLNRKNNLLEKSKKVLEEQLLLYKQEIISKNKKIQQLTLKINKNSFAIAETESCISENDDYLHMEVILCEKQEQLNLVSESLMQKTKLLQELMEENQQLKDQISSKNNIISQFKQVTKAQMGNLKNQIHELEQQIQEKSNQIVSVKLFHQNLSQKESLKWQKINQSLRQKNYSIEEQMNNLLLKQQNQFHQKQTLKDRNEQLSHQILSLKETISWLMSVLQEAKGQFINVQLKQQEQLEKEEKEKREYRKRNKLLKTQLKNFKLEGSANASTCEPSNKSTRTSHTFSITPFRANSGRSRLSDSHQQD